jgi:uncharacterized membrane protein YhaH (DUF805 family)
MKYPDIDRLNYFGLRAMLFFVGIFAFFYFGPESKIFSVLSLVVMIAGVVLDVMRLQNIGASQWLMFLRFVPYAGLLLSIFLQSAQKDWTETRSFDRTGWIIIGIHAAFVAFIIYLLIKNPAMSIFGLSFSRF